MYKFSFESPFKFDDIVEFKASHASGRGRVMDIALGSDGKIYYMIIRDDGDAEGGIFPHEMRLIQSAGTPDVPSIRQ
ncbi:MAG: hypothetical protein K8T89_26265 [Planctomycetes bacterium]|nr:hypothetical protein [Planctomycetota bacterium]